VRWVPALVALLHCAPGRAGARPPPLASGAELREVSADGKLAERTRPGLPAASKSAGLPDGVNSSTLRRSSTRHRDVEIHLFRREAAAPAVAAVAAGGGGVARMGGSLCGEAGGRVGVAFTSMHVIVAVAGAEAAAARTDDEFEGATWQCVGAAAADEAASAAAALEATCGDSAAMVLEDWWSSDSATLSECDNNGADAGGPTVSTDEEGPGVGLNNDDDPGTGTGPGPGPGEDRDRERDRDWSTDREAATESAPLT